MKLEKRTVARRVDKLIAEGIEFVTAAHVGAEDGVPVEDLIVNHDAVLLAVGATEPRDLPLEGRDLDGVEFAMVSYVFSTTKKKSNRSINGGGETPYLLRYS